MDALRDFGLSEEEIAEITGGTLDESGEVSMGYVPTDGADPKTVDSIVAVSDR